ncbi:enediyne biosynthesis protein [Paractinoplanes deccanensis]|uniref:Enediyne biosynthesis protein n=1 Tax=Paractinoplanes deccanensis TaxID=113561 RepID=A0ABQ3XYB9_9ACTN|nr:DUF1702 family protein [Actinoplanes deccanensis]GID72737.1 enediyne biosynthesis protein [Actinoplanes deccanensis]
MTGARTAPHRLGWRRLLVLRPALVDFASRGFATEPAATRAHLEAAAGAFLDGFNAELATGPDDPPDLAATPAPRRGFAAEGAAMATALLDAARPTGTRRTEALHAAYGDRYAYLLHVGSGWAMAKLHRRRLGRIGAPAPLLRWLAYDGKGFCEGFFAGPARLGRWRRHAGPCSAVCEIEYQGLGRSLWFRACGDPDRLAGLITAMPARHHGDLWSGAGLAAAYAGGVDAGAYGLLAERANDHRAALAQGAAFAAEARRLGGDLTEQTDVAVRALAGAEAGEAAAWTWTAREGLDGPSAGASTYREWRRRVQRLAAAAGAKDAA